MQRWPLYYFKFAFRTDCCWFLPFRYLVSSRFSDRSRIMFLFSLCRAVATVRRTTVRQYEYKSNLRLQYAKYRRPAEQNCNRALSVGVPSFFCYFVLSQLKDAFTTSWLKKNKWARQNNKTVPILPLTWYCLFFNN
jgi:hypothetical protein